MNGLSTRLNLHANLVSGHRGQLSHLTVPQNCNVQINVNADNYFIRADIQR
uniref:Uncharacterized protein n=1 Tax=Arundo donax TaxID=35708 RepID=A0A0A8Z7X9_ARUDO